MRVQCGKVQSRPELKTRNPIQVCKKMEDMEIDGPILFRLKDHHLRDLGFDKVVSVSMDQG